MSFSVSSSSLTLGNLSTPPSVKKKRGRPPKPTSLSNKITTTLNIIVNTSPLYNSPTAENNSNMIVKRGAPDIFTPLMRVSPTSRRKRSRKSSMSSETSSSSKRVYPEMLATPLSGKSYDYANTLFESVDSRAMDRISYLTKPPKYEHGYDTPIGLHLDGKETLRRDVDASPSHSGRVENTLLTPTNSLINEGESTRGRSRLDYYLESALYTLDEVMQRRQSTKSLLPAASLAKDTFNRDQDKEQNDFAMRLMVDDLGKAVLSNSFFLSPKRAQTISPGNSDSRDKRTFERDTITFHTNQEFYPPQTAPPVLGLCDSVPHKIGYASDSNENHEESHPVPGALKRHHSDITGMHSHNFSSSSFLSTINEGSYNESHLDKFMPLTPTNKDTSSHSLASGLTPAGLNLNLTPNFNSLMNSMMNINSPQQKKSYYRSQFSPHQELFPEFSLGGRSSVQHYGLESMTDLMNLGSKLLLTKYTDANNMAPTSSTSSNSTNLNVEDGGDARLALRKIMQIKKK